MRFSDIISPIEVADFIGHVMDASPIYIPGTSDKFSKLFTREAFWDCVAAGKREGSLLPRASLTAHQLPLALETDAVTRALRSGNTVCVSHIDRTSSRLRRLCIEVEQELGLPGVACVHCYYSPPGTGYSFFHMDNGVAVTLQLEGKKSWLHSASPAVRWPPRVGGFLEKGRLDWFGDSDWRPRPGTVPSPEQQGFIEHKLSPGDVLVMPPGVWHNVSASESTSISLNLKLTLSPAIDAVLQMVRHLCLDEDIWRAPLPFATSDELTSGSVSQRSTNELRALLKRLSVTIDDVSKDDSAVSRMFLRNYLGSQDNIQPAESRIVTQDDTLMVPEGIFPILSAVSPAAVSLVGQGRILGIQGPSVGPMIRSILKVRHFSVRDVKAWESARGISEEEIMQVLQKLFDTGFLSICES